MSVLFPRVNNVLWRSNSEQTPRKQYSEIEDYVAEKMQGRKEGRRSETGTGKVGLHGFCLYQHVQANEDYVHNSIAKRSKKVEVA